MVYAGIDPGTLHSAVCFFDYDRMTILEHLDLPNHDLLRWLRVHCVRTGLVSIEMVECQGLKLIGKETFQTVRWVGRFEQVCSDRGVPVQLVTRGKILIHHCGRRQGVGDPNIKRAVMDRFPATGGGANPYKGTKSQPGPLYGISDHEWQALACALYAADNNKNIPLF